MLSTGSSRSIVTDVAMGSPSGLRIVPPDGRPVDIIYVMQLSFEIPSGLMGNASRLMICAQFDCQDVGVFAALGFQIHGYAVPTCSLISLTSAHRCYGTWHNCKTSHRCWGRPRRFHRPVLWLIKVAPVHETLRFGTQLCIQRYVQALIPLFLCQHS